MDDMLCIAGCTATHCCASLAAFIPVLQGHIAPVFLVRHLHLCGVVCPHACQDPLVRPSHSPNSPASVVTPQSSVAFACTRPVVPSLPFETCCYADIYSEYILPSLVSNKMKQQSNQAQTASNNLGIDCQNTASCCVAYRRQLPHMNMHSCAHCFQIAILGVKLAGYATPHLAVPTSTAFPVCRLGLGMLSTDCR